MPKNLLRIVKNTAIEGETRPLVVNTKWCIDGSDNSWHWLTSKHSKLVICEWRGSRNNYSYTNVY